MIVRAVLIMEASRVRSTDASLCYRAYSSSQVRAILLDDVDL